MIQIRSPLVKNTEAVQGLAALAASGPAGDTRRSNSKQWISIAEFLDTQHLAILGLKRVARKAPARGKAPREVHPVGNTGTTSQPALQHLGAVTALSLGFNRG